MHKVWMRLAGCLLVMAFTVVCVAAQSNGVFSVTKSAISNGGDTSSSGVFSVKASLGQAIASDASSGGSFNTRGGFWPSGGIVVVAGTLLSSQGRGIRRATIKFTDPQGNYFVALSGRLGNFRFSALEPNKTYTVTIQNARFHFAPQSFNFGDNALNLTIMALP